LKSTKFYKYEYIVIGPISSKRLTNRNWLKLEPDTNRDSVNSIVNKNNSLLNSPKFCQKGIMKTRPNWLSISRSKKL